MARRNTPIAEFPKLWQRHEALYRGIFIKALRQLEVTDEKRKDEDALSEVLCPVFKGLCFFDKDKPPTPQSQIPISPVSDSELKGGQKCSLATLLCHHLSSTS